MHRFGLVVFSIIFVGSLVGRATAAELKTATEWPTWRGTDRDAISDETGLLDRWNKGGPPLAWRIDGLGKGYSSLAIADGKIFTMGERSGNTFLIALDLENGDELWAAPVGGADPNSTPTVDGNLVYALGRTGELVCADTETGNIVWKKSFEKDFGGKMMSHWGYSESPLIDGDRLICTPGGLKATVVALDKRDGKVIWKANVPGAVAHGGAGYASAVISEGGGVRQYVQLIGKGLVSVAADDGRFLWSYERIVNGTANIPTPIVSGDYIFCSTGYQTGAALLELSPAEKNGGVKAREVYFLDSRTMQNHHGGMVLLDGYVYSGHGHKQGFPLCIELKTGKVAWRQSRGAGRGSAAVVYADGHLYFRYEDATMALIEANPRQYSLKGTFKIAANNGPSWPHPVIAGKRLYLRDGAELLCYDIAAGS